MRKEIDYSIVRKRDKGLILPPSSYKADIRQLEFIKDAMAAEDFTPQTYQGLSCSSAEWLLAKVKQLLDKNKPR